MREKQRPDVQNSKRGRPPTRSAAPFFGLALGIESSECSLFARDIQRVGIVTGRQRTRCRWPDPVRKQPESWRCQCQKPQSCHSSQKVKPGRLHASQLASQLAALDPSALQGLVLEVKKTLMRMFVLKEARLAAKLIKTLHL